MKIKTIIDADLIHSDNYTKIQFLGGIVSTFYLAMLSFVSLFLKITFANKLFILSIAISLCIFFIFYFLNPALINNKKLAALPDLFYLPSILLIFLLSGYGFEILILYLCLLLVINAFTKPKVIYPVLSLVSWLIILIAYILVQGYAASEIAFLSLGFLVIAIVLRFLSKETISLREKGYELIQEAKQLKAQKEEIYNLINNISDGLISVDEKRIIRFINNKAARTLTAQQDSEDLIGKSVDDIFITTDNNGRVSPIAEAMIKQETIIRDGLKLLKNDYTARITLSVAPIFNDNKKVAGAIILFRDITSERKLEEQRAEFNAIASHELRTPLALIDGFIFNLQNDKKLKYDKKTKDYIQHIADASNSLILLTNNILTVSRIENNQLRISLEKTDISKLVHETIKSLKDKTERKKLKLTVKLEKNLPLVLTDPEKIKEVIISLVENSIKFTKTGSIHLSGKVSDKKEIILSVTDTGIGISKSNQKRIFEKFFRTEDWETRKTGGTGLELYISKIFITELGGKIGVNSELGKGSSFWFSIPVIVKRVKRKKKHEKKLDEFVKNI